MSFQHAFWVDNNDNNNFQDAYWVNNNDNDNNFQNAFWVNKNNDNNSQDALWINLKEEEELLVSDQVVGISPDYGPVAPVSISFLCLGCSILPAPPGQPCSNIVAKAMSCQVCHAGSSIPLTLRWQPFQTDLLGGEEGAEELGQIQLQGGAHPPPDRGGQSGRQPGLPAPP